MISKISLRIALVLVVGAFAAVRQTTWLPKGNETVTQLLAATPGSPADQEDNEDFDYNFAVKDLHGNKVTLEKYRGKVIFLNLWATWCGPCRAEMPTIQKLYDRTAGDSVMFVILSVDQDPKKIGPYIKNNSYTFPVYEPSGRLPRQLHVPMIPTTFIVSKSGKIIRKEVGSTNFNTTKFKNFLETEAKR